MKFLKHYLMLIVLVIFMVTDSCYAIKGCDVMQTSGSNFSEFNQLIKTTYITEFDLWIKPELTFNYIKFVMNTSSLTISSNHFIKEEWNHIYVKTWYSYQKTWDQCMSAAIVNDKGVFTQLLNCPAELISLYNLLQKKVYVSGGAKISFGCNPKLKNSNASDKEEGLFAAANFANRPFPVDQTLTLGASQPIHRSTIIGVVVPLALLVVGLLLILFYIMCHYKGRLTELEKHHDNNAMIDISKRSMKTDDNNYEEIPAIQSLPIKTSPSIQVPEAAKFLESTG